MDIFIENTDLIKNLVPYEIKNIHSTLYNKNYIVNILYLQHEIMRLWENKAIP